MFFILLKKKKKTCRVKKWREMFSKTKVAEEIRKKKRKLGKREYRRRGGKRYDVGKR